MSKEGSNWFLSSAPVCLPIQIMAVPSQRSGIGYGGTRNAAMRHPVHPGGMGGMPRVEGPHKFVDHMFNPITTHKLSVLDMDVEGLSDQTEMHEHTYVMVVKLVRPDVAEKHAAMSLWQTNLFLSEMTRHAELAWARWAVGANKKYKQTQYTINRLIGTHPELEIIKFLSHRWVHQFVNFAGIQYGNRYVNAISGPGIAVATSGSVEARNIAMEGFVREQDTLWLILGPDGKSRALAYTLHSLSKGAPSVLDREYVDRGGVLAVGPAHRVGFVADKTHEDMHSSKHIQIANGLAGTVQEMHMTEYNAPRMRIVVAATGLKAQCV